MAAIAAATDDATAATSNGERTSAPTNALRVALRPVDVNNIGTLRVLNRVTFPVSYSNKFYKDLLRTPEPLRQMAYCDANVVGAVVCRVEDSPSRDGEKRLYMMTLGVLAAYRGRKVGSKMMQHVIDWLRSGENSDINQIYLHVHTINEDAVAFYRRFGFEISEEIPDYYKKIEPTSCYVLTRAFPTEDDSKVMAAAAEEKKKKKAAKKKGGDARKTA